MVSKGQELELLIESAAFEGNSVARLDNLVVFVPYVVPGDRVRVRVIRKRRKHLEAVPLELIEASPFRVEPRCRYFGICGGCKLQNLDYHKQLDFKRDQVEQLMRRIGKLDDIDVRPTLGSENGYYYRNKMEFTFGSNRWLTQEEIDSGEELSKGFALGLHIPKRFDKILDLNECFLQSELSSRIVNRVRELALKSGWTAYNTHKHSGYLRNLVVRNGVNTGEVMLILVTSSYDAERLETLAQVIAAQFPEVTTLLNSINSTRSPVASGQKQYICFGEGVLHERLGNLTFQISPTSFFQPNTLQAERLFETIFKLAHLTPEHVLYDVYCGLGAIGLYLSGHAKKVVGIESHSESVSLANENAKLNQVANAEFEAGDACDALDEAFVARHGFPDLVVLDPPRAGLDIKLVNRLLALKPKRIVYTSCNPATQARDLEILRESYRIECVQPVDMFPQTYHIEAVASLSLLPG